MGPSSRRAGDLTRRIERGGRLAAALALAAAGSGCIAYTVASTAVDVAAGAVSVTTDVVTGTVDLVVPDGDDED